MSVQERWKKCCGWWSNQRNPLWGLTLRMKLNDRGFRPPLWTCRLNLARITSWEWWDEWDDTEFAIRVLAVWGRARYVSATEAPTIFNLYLWADKKHFVSLKLNARAGSNPRSLDIPTRQLEPLHQGTRPRIDIRRQKTSGSHVKSRSPRCAVE